MSANRESGPTDPGRQYQFLAPDDLWSKFTEFFDNRDLAVSRRRGGTSWRIVAGIVGNPIESRLSRAMLVAASSGQVILAELSLPGLKPDKFAFRPDQGSYLPHGGEDLQVSPPSQYTLVGDVIDNTKFDFGMADYAGRLFSTGKILRL